jgi:hypothetical protein
VLIRASFTGFLGPDYSNAFGEKNGVKVEFKSTDEQFFLILPNLVARCYLTIHINGYHDKIKWKSSFMRKPVQIGLEDCFNISGRLECKYGILAQYTWEFDFVKLHLNEEVPKKITERRFSIRLKAGND